MIKDLIQKGHYGGRFPLQCGGYGDLSQVLLTPAHRDNRRLMRHYGFAHNLAPLGVDLLASNDEEYQRLLQLDEARYYAGDTTNRDVARHLLSHVQAVYQGRTPLCYFATSPGVARRIIEALDETGWMKPGVFSHPVRAVIEKPFGSSLDDALSLNDLCERTFGKEHTYRVVHSASKSMSLIMRACPLRKLVKPQYFVKPDEIISIWVRIAESVRVPAKRAAYYDKEGQLGDMMFHLWIYLTECLASLLELGLEPGRRGHFKKDIRFDPRYLQVAQYEGYRDEVGFPYSNTPTRIRCKGSIELAGAKRKLRIDTGKGLDNKRTQVVLWRRRNNGDKEGLVIQFDPFPALFLIEKGRNDEHPRKIVHDVATPAFYELLSGLLLPKDPAAPDGSPSGSTPITPYSWILLNLLGEAPRFGVSMDMPEVVGVYELFAGLREEAQRIAIPERLLSYGPDGYLPRVQLNDAWDTSDVSH